MQPKRTAEDIKAQLAVYQGRKSYDPNSPLPGVKTNTSGGNSTPDAGAAGSNALIEALTARLTSQGQGISSSSSSNLQSSINDAIASTIDSGNLSSSALELQRQRELGYAQDRASATITGSLEGRTGYATQIVALRELTETTEKSVRDLDMRYKEAIMSNDSATAQRVADLQMQKLEYAQQQEQNFYSNLFSLANLQSQEASRQQQADQFNRGLTAEEQQFEKKLGFDLSMFEKETARDERNEVMRLAAEYGVPVGANETIESMVGKVAPFASEEQRLRLQEIRSSISANNARAAESLKRLEDPQMDDTTVNAFAMAYMAGEKDILVDLDTELAGKIYSRVTEMRTARDNDLSVLAKSSSGEQDFIMKVENADVIATPEDVQRYVELYGEQWHKNKGRTSYNVNNNLTDEEKLQRDRLMGVTISAP